MRHVTHPRWLLAPALAAALALAACAGPLTTAPTPAPTTPPAPPAATPTAAPTTAPTTVPTAAPTTAPGGAARLTGTIRSAAGDLLVLTDGRRYHLDSQTRIIRLEAARPSDLRAGDYVAITAKRQPDNTLLASMVNIFPASLRGVAGGQRPMAGGNLMTNATIDTISGDSFTVTFPGGGARIRLAPGARISRLLDVRPSDLKEGESVTILADGDTARSITVLTAGSGA